MKLASIEVIKSINPHNNADKLEICEILGYKCIIQKGIFQAGERVVFIFPDSVLPDTEWSKPFKAKSNRVKAIRLRNIWSEGLVLKPEEVGLQTNLAEGTDIAEVLHIIHYEPPIPQSLDAKCNLRFGLQKTDEERIENLENIPYGEEVIVTLKMDGCLDGQTLIETERGLIQIKEICDKKLNISILTRNLELNINEYKPILNYNISDENRDWYEVETENGELIKLTGNHRVWLPKLKCYRSVEDLKENDYFLIKNR